MRVNRFTFKKTKRVKQVVVHPGLSVDLTVPEAEALIGIMDEGSDEVDEGPDPVGEAMYDLYNSLVGFVRDNK